MIEIKDKKDCCGCTACESICPMKCIRMIADEEGFMYPKVDSKKCVNCHLCERVCPIINKPKLPQKSEAAFIVQSEDPKVLSESTSGGFIDMLGQEIIDLGGVVCGVVYSEEFMPKHILIEKKSELALLRNSKYAQSELSGVFQQIKRSLIVGRTVLFIGTPCQVAGLKNYLVKDYKNLLTVDLVCRSIPSPLLFKEYLQWQRKKYGSEIKRVICRNKTYGYHNGSLIIEFENGKIYSGSNRVDPYMKSFHHDVCSRPSCYDCRFKTKRRVSDFTVFDSWQPDHIAEGIIDNNKGYSNVIIHSLKGVEYFKKINGLKKWESSAEKMFLYTAGMESKSIIKPQARDDYYNNLRQHGFEYAYKKAIRISCKDRIIEKIKSIIWKERVNIR